MFIFERPFRAVAAGLGVALLMAYLGGVSDGTQPVGDAARVAVGTVRLVPVILLGLSSAPVRDLSLSCRLPPASICELASESEKPNRSRPGGSACADDPSDLGMRSC